MVLGHLVTFILLSLCGGLLAAGANSTAKKVQRKPAEVGSGSDTRGAPESLKKQIEAERQKWLIPELKVDVDETKMLKELERVIVKENPALNPWIVPGSSVSTPAAFGAQWSDIFVGGAISPPTYQSGAKTDLVGFAGFGLGDATKYIGFESVVAAYSIFPPFRSGALSFKVHRVLPRGFAVAAGRENALDWENDTAKSWYGVVSKFILLSDDERAPFSILFLHAGAGNGRFSSIGVLDPNQNNIRPFGAAAIRIIQPVVAILNWTGIDIATGVSITPFRRFPLNISLSAHNYIIKPYFGGIRTNISISWGDSWKSDTFPL